jgi:transcription termination factor Rho
MNKAELESKHLAELHVLAAEAGIEGYRMLPRAELIERLSGGGRAPKPGGETRREGGGRRPRERGRRPREPRRERREEPRREREEPRREPERPSPAAGPPPPGERPKRRRRRRRWGRRRKEVRVRDLLLPAAGGRQAIVYGETREACTVLLREIAADVSGEKGPDPVALLVDPSPEELADWKRDAPRAEIVSAGKAVHADDAIAQAVRRAESGEEVILLVDSLSRFAEAFGGGEEAKQLFDAGRAVAGNGSLTVVAAVERSV